MSSEAAQKAYPMGDEPWGNMVHFLNQQAFDRGGVEALKAAIKRAQRTTSWADAIEALFDLRDEWEVGQ